MISNEINDFINKIMKKTENNELNWHNSENLLGHSSYWASMPQALQEVVEYCINEKVGTSLYTGDSFYLCDKGRYLFLLHIAHEPERGKGIKDTWELLAILSQNDKTFISIPDFHPANESDRLKKISDLIVKNKAAEQERIEKRLLEFFDTFL